MTAPAGPLASEAAQLLDVLAERLQQVRDRQRGTERPDGEAPAGDVPGSGGQCGDGDGGDVPGGEGHGGDEDSDAAPAGGERSGGDGTDRAGRCPECGHDPSAASCTGCPLCAARAVLRGERPETIARLVDGALTIVQALQGLLAGGAGARPAAHGEGPAAAEPGVARPSSARSGAADADGDPAPGLIRIDVQ